MDAYRTGNSGMTEILAFDSVLNHRSSFTRALIRWGRRHARAYPWRKGLPLWQALIVEVMLQRTRADQVVPAFSEFQNRYSSPEVLALAGEGELAKLMEPLGLRWRSRHLHQLALEIGRRGGELPQESVGS